VAAKYIFKLNANGIANEIMSYWVLQLTEAVVRKNVDTANASLLEELESLRREKEAWKSASLLSDQNVAFSHTRKRHKAIEKSIINPRQKV
jgi:hypothetical protein